MSQRLLTKSRFKLGLECPNKLYYTKKQDYANQQLEDTFLESLAQGGFQVEELARLEYSDGILIENNDWNYDLLVEQTNKLLQRENVVIFEAAFKFENLFIRTDILVKRGNDIQLIEVKAKSFDPDDEYTLIGKRGGLVSAWKPYLFDVAFQRYVIQKCHSDWNIKSYLKLADKTRTAKVEGLNQLFRITKTANNRTGITRKVDSLEEVGGTVLGSIAVDHILDEIENGTHRYVDLGFEESIKVFAEYYEKDKYFGYPVSWVCKSCEFKTSVEEEETGKNSGFKECWSKQKGWTDKEFEKAKTFDIWNFRKGSKLFEQEDKIFQEELSPEDVGVKLEAGKISASERQWIQIEKTVEEDDSAFILKGELKEELQKLKFPLNFIDFETSMTALPFNKGRRPYEQVAFQFSHHTVSENGVIEHESEYINFEPGQFPNFEFLRELKKALLKNNGSIFRYAAHENTILNVIYDQLIDSDEQDKDELKNFIKSVSQSTGSRVEEWKGERNMIDLCKIVKDYYYSPFMQGSNSIKAVLPAVLKTSNLLRTKYSQPLTNLQISSKNFAEDHIWLRKENGEILSPYKTLPALFDGWTDDQLDTTVSEMDNIADGGAALTAYGKLQFTDMSGEERLEIKNSLLKYCELDTLAMVMIYEHFYELTA